MLNRGGDFKARRGCGIIWLGSCNNKQRFSSSPSSSRRDGAAKGKPGCTKMPCMVFSPAVGLHGRGMGVSPAEHHGIFQQDIAQHIPC